MAAFNLVTFHPADVRAARRCRTNPFRSIERRAQAPCLLPEDDRRPPSPT